MTSDPMAALRTKYVAKLRDRRPEIAAFLGLCESGQPEKEARDEMRHKAHGLAGSGATYGFSRISTTARALELALQSESVIESSILVKLTKALLETCDQVLGGPPRTVA